MGNISSILLLHNCTIAWLNAHKMTWTTHNFAFCQNAWPSYISGHNNGNTFKPCSRRVNVAWWWNLAKIYLKWTSAWANSIVHTDDDGPLLISLFKIRKRANKTLLFGAEKLLNIKEEKLKIDSTNYLLLVTIFILWIKWFVCRWIKIHLHGTE